MLKKMMLLASMSLAAMALAIPAAAQANLDWNASGQIHGSGALTSTSETGLETGPANVTFTGSVTKGSTTGVITAFTISGTVPTNVEGCTAVGTTSNLPWVVHLTTPDTMTITDVTFTNHYSGVTCALAGVPSEVDVTGDVTLTVTGSNAASSDEYDDSGVLKIEGTQIGVDITGDVTWTGPGITGL